MQRVDTTVCWYSAGIHVPTRRTQVGFIVHGRKALLAPEHDGEELVELCAKGWGSKEQRVRERLHETPHTDHRHDAPIVPDKSSSTSAIIWKSSSSLGVWPSDSRT